MQLTVGIEDLRAAHRTLGHEPPAFDAAIDSLRGSSLPKTGVPKLHSSVREGWILDLLEAQRNPTVRSGIVERVRAELAVFVRPAGAP